MPAASQNRRSLNSPPTAVNTRLRLAAIVERSDTPLGRVFDLTVQGLIVLSLVSFALDTLPDLTESQRATLRLIEVLTVAAFTAEYALRLYVAERRLGFVFSFYGLVDLASIAPFYITGGLDLRSLRAVRLIRLFRIFKLARYGGAIRRFSTAFRIAREELILFLSASAILLYVSAVGIYYFEHGAQPERFETLFDALWWSVSTLTTVGYGDIYPITAGGRVFTAVILFLGLGIVAVPAGLVASALSQVRAREADEAKAPEGRGLEPRVPR
jgi:voltage-gated potassium channel